MSTSLFVSTGAVTC